MNSCADKLLFSLVAITCAFDGAFAIYSFKHFGDLHISWAANSFIVSGLFAWMAFRDRYDG